MAPLVAILWTGIAMIITGLILFIVLLMRMTDWRMERFAAEDRYRYVHTIPVSHDFDAIEKSTAELRAQIAELSAQLRMIVETTEFLYTPMENENAAPDWPPQQASHGTWFVQHQQEITWR